MLTCAIYHTFPCQSLVRTKMDPTGNKPFWLYGLSMGIKVESFESVKMAVGVSFTSNIGIPVMRYERAARPCALNFRLAALKCRFGRPPNALSSVGV